MSKKYGGVKNCRFCGKVLLEEKDLARYNDVTGKPMYRVILTCPDKRWYNCHDRRTWSPYGFEEVTYDY
jgi:hypothetical protein